MLCNRTIVDRLLLCLILIGVTLPCFAQSDSIWVTEAQGTISFTQVGFQRWHDGGISSYALGTGIRTKTEGNVGGSRQGYEVRLLFGVVKQGDVALRKSDDLIHIRTAFSFPGMPIFGRLSPVVDLDLRSQFANGYQYTEMDSILGTPQISGFLSPAIFTQSLGLDYPVQPWLNLRLGVAAKETIVTIRSLRSRYKVPLDTAFRWQMGIAGLFSFERTILPNVDLQSSLTLFLAFNQQSPDSIWETLLTMKVNTWLQINTEYTALYDRDLSPYIQQKQSLSVGVSFKIL